MVALRELLAVVSAHEWRKKGVPVPAVQAAGREAMRKLLRQAQRLPAEVQARLRANARFYGL